jgi:hypothetical protein
MDFTIGPIAPVSLQAGQSTTFTAQVVPVGGFAGQVTLTSAGVPGAAGLSFAPSPTATLSGGAQTATGTIMTSPTATTCGSYSLPVTATSGSISHSATVALSIHGGAAPGFTASAPSVTVTQGITASSSIAIVSSACLTGTAAFSYAGFAGLTVALPATGSIRGRGVGDDVRFDLCDCAGRVCGGSI